MSLLPAEPALELLHTREYETRVYRLDDEHILVRGAIRDEKPPGLYVIDDPEPLTIHDMLVELTVAVDGFVIIDAAVSFITHPDEGCPAIIEHYRKLIGLSVARGFNRNVRDLFGGPRGCAHTTALLQAMGPAVIQSAWSLSLLAARKGDLPRMENGPEARERAMARNLNTCHVWDEHGQRVAMMRKGESGRRGPLSVHQRLRELGREDELWGP